MNLVKRNYEWRLNQMDSMVSLMDVMLNWPLNLQYVPDDDNDDENYGVYYVVVWNNCQFRVIFPPMHLMGLMHP